MVDLKDDLVTSTNVCFCI